MVVLQAAQTIASLFLPTLNADIIDKGVATGDTAYIWRHGARHARRQRSCRSRSPSPPSTTARRSRWHSAATSARALFHQVTEFSATEVAHFGAPSLITRITNDVQQVQTLVQMTCTLLIAAPITAIGGTDHGAAGGRRADLDPRRRHPACSCFSIGTVIFTHGADVPADAGPHRRASTGCCASRSPASASCARSCASRTRRERFQDGNDELTRTALARRPADGADVPDRDRASSTCRASR